MRVMLDDELLMSEPSGGWSWQELLAGLLSHRDVSLLRYSDDGPPRDAPTMSTFSGDDFAIGWMQASLAPAGGFASHTLKWSDGETASDAAIVGNAVEHARRDTRTYAYASMQADQAMASRAADVVAACAAREFKADIFITTREYLHATTWPVGDGTAFCTPREALALVSLYVRSRGEFLVWENGRVHVRLSKGLYYLVGARAMLPAGWRWYSAMEAHDRQHGLDDLTYLGAAVFQRVTRALQARDDVARALSQLQNADVAEDAALGLDTCLISLMGALDAAARIAHRVLKLGGSQRAAGWQSPEWRAKVTARCAGLGAVVEVGSPGAQVLTVLSKMRNSVHGEGLRASALRRSSELEQTLVGLPKADQGAVEEAVESLGGLSEWGFRKLVPNELHADPHLLLEKLLPATLVLLDSLMAATPVERLPNYAPLGEDAFPPKNDQESAFGPRHRDSVRWQLGL